MSYASWCAPMLIAGGLLGGGEDEAIVIKVEPLAGEHAGVVTTGHMDEGAASEPAPSKPVLKEVPAAPTEPVGVSRGWQGTTPRRNLGGTLRPVPVSRSQPAPVIVERGVEEPARKPGVLSRLKRVFVREKKQPATDAEKYGLPKGATLISVREVGPEEALQKVPSDVKNSDQETIPSAPAKAEQLEPPAKPAPLEHEVSYRGTPVTATVEPVRPDATIGKDYRWVQGTLQYVRVGGGMWVVRYAPLDQADPYGGSMVLARDRRLDEYKEGDVVRVEGEIVKERASMYLGGPLYRVREITLVRRATR